jgi:hypothetical protein
MAAACASRPVDSRARARRDPGRLRLAGHAPAVFETATASYGVADEEAELDELPEDGVYLHEVLREPGDRLCYTYDFGDMWQHEIVLERVIDPIDAAECLDGAAAGPSEDSGGAHGYAEMLAVAADPTHPEHEDVRAWLGGFDPARFNLDKVNRALSRLR